MRQLLLVLTLFSSPVFARTNFPELVDWGEYMAMTEVHKDQYLHEVAQAMADFEDSTNQVYASELLARNSYFRDWFNRISVELSPRAQAEEVADPCANVSFEVPNGGVPGLVCAKYGDHSRACTNPGSGLGGVTRNAGADKFAALATQCPRQYGANFRVANEYNKFADSRGRPQIARPQNSIANNDASAARTAGDKSKQAPVQTADVGRSAESSTASGNLRKLSGDCAPVSDADRAAARKSYREGQRPPCLIAGTLSKYGAGDASTCGHRTRGTSTDGKAFQCSDTNTYSSNGKLGRVPASRRTVCQSTLYCGKDKDKAPFCVQTSDKAFASCDLAVKANGDKLQFGKACVGDDVRKYRSLESSLTAICDQSFGTDTNKDQKTRALLCSDCKALKIKLDLAQSRNSDFSPRSESPNGGGGPATH